MYSGITDAEVANQIRTMITPNKEEIIKLTPDRLEQRSSRNNMTNFVPRNLKVIMAARIASLEKWAEGK